MLKFMEIKCNEPKLTHKQISNQLGYSDSTTKRYRDDTNMKSLYKGGDYKNRSAKHKTCTSTTEISKSITNKKTKKIALKGGDPSKSDIGGKKLVEQAFSQ